jgi:hypothetical protein
MNNVFKGSWILLVVEGAAKEFKKFLGAVGEVGFNPDLED